MIASDIRATIAAIALADTHGRSVTGLYDYAQARHLNLTANVTGQAVNAIDMDHKTKMTGTLPDIFDNARSSYIHLAGTGGKYTGFDHQSGTHFNVEVSGETVALYDHEAASWSQFSG